MAPSAYFFCFALTIFLFFTAYVVLSPKRNPFYQRVLDSQDYVDEATVLGLRISLYLVVGILFFALLLSIPFFRVIGGIAMLVCVSIFLLQRRRISPPEPKREANPFDYEESMGEQREEADRTFEPATRDQEEQRLEGERLYPGGFQGGRE